MTSTTAINNLNFWVTTLSPIVSEHFYVIDVKANRICYIQPDLFSLQEPSIVGAVNPGFEFYNKMIYCRDLSLWEKMRSVIFLYINNGQEKTDKVSYFSCTFRLQCKYSFFNGSLPQMTRHRMKPVWINEQCYLICTMSHSTIRNVGNLRMYSNDGLTYEEYNLISQRWEQRMIESLTEREKAILMLAKQGKNPREISVDLCKGYHTIRNQIKQLFSKLDAHSMQEAIEYANYHGAHPG